MSNLHPKQFEEHLALLGKLSKLDDRFGENYTFRRGHYHDPDNGTYHTDMISRNPRQWAGSIEHNEDGHVSHLYVQKEHRAGLASLVLEASRVAHAAGGELPRTGDNMTPKAENLFKKQLPITRSTQRVALTPPITTYGDN